MIVSLRPLDDCIITVEDVSMIAVYESRRHYMECALLNVSLQRKDGDISHFEEICDLEVF